VDNRLFLRWAREGDNPRVIEEVQGTLSEFKAHGKVDLYCCKVHIHVPEFAAMDLNKLEKHVERDRKTFEGWREGAIDQLKTKGKVIPQTLVPKMVLQLKDAVETRYREAYDVPIDVFRKMVAKKPKLRKRAEVLGSD
jgi:hypothetical protein